MHPGTLCFISQRDGACHETMDLATKYLICIASIKNSHLSLREACGDFVLDSDSKLSALYMSLSRRIILAYYLHCSGCRDV